MTILLTKITAGQNEDALSYQRVRVLYVTKVALLESVKVVFKLFTSHLDNL